MKQVSKIFFCVLLAGVANRSIGQTNTSPYSVIGIGDIETGSLDRSAGMANTGVSLSSFRFMYHSNPASYVKLQDKFFAFEMTGRFKAVNYVGKPIASTTGTSTDLQVAKLAVAAKVKPWWGASIGLLPYSASNYSFLTTKGVVGDLQYNMGAYYKGSGGLNKAYFANSFQLNKNLAVGVEAGYIFGSMQQVETLDASELTGSTISTTSDRYMRNALFKGGLQYNGKISDKLKVALGATASNKTRLNTTNYVTVVNGSSTVVSDKDLGDASFYLPVSYTVGGSINYNRKFTVAADYQRQNWNDLNYTGLSYRLVNSDRYSIGFEYSAQQSLPGYNNTPSGLFFEKYFLQAGFFYGNSYLRMYNEQLQNFGGTIGLGMNSKKSNLSYQLSVELGSYGTTKSNLIKQNYSTVNFTVMYRDFWFTKMKKYD